MKINRRILLLRLIARRGTQTRVVEKEQKVFSRVTVHFDRLISHLVCFASPLYTAYSTFYIVGLVLSMQIPFVGFQPIRTSEHMAAAGKSRLRYHWECLILQGTKTSR